MSFHLRITGPAERDMRENHRWWSKYRSTEQADRWLIGIDEVIYALRNTADQQGWASEIELQEAGIKQVAFGLGRKPSHRVIFGIDGDSVVVYRVRAFKQDKIELRDLTESE